MNKDQLEAIVNGELDVTSLSSEQRAVAIKMLLDRRAEIDREIADKTSNFKEEEKEIHDVISLTWIERYRKNTEYNEYGWTEYWLIHTSGRIMAIVSPPSREDKEGPFEAEIKAILIHDPRRDKDKNEYAFLGLDDAKRWCESIVRGKPPSMDMNE